jgi:hypothetical protein
MIRIVGFAMVLACLTVGPTSLVAHAAVPSQLLNKTISVAYITNAIAKSPDGRVFNAPRRSRRTIYISSLGRIFSRTELTRLRGRLSRTADKDPQQTGFRYQNGALVGTFLSISGAVRITINFDSVFQSCNVDVLYGKASGKPFKWTSLSGEIYEAQGAMTVSGRSCSIRDGNAFAEE